MNRQSGADFVTAMPEPGRLPAGSPSRPAGANRPAKGSTPIPSATAAAQRAAALAVALDEAVSSVVRATYAVAGRGEGAALGAHDLLRWIPRRRQVLELAIARVNGDAGANPDSMVMRRAGELLVVLDRIGLFY